MAWDERRRGTLVLGLNFEDILEIFVGDFRREFVRDFEKSLVEKFWKRWFWNI